MPRPSRPRTTRAQVEDEQQFRAGSVTLIWVTAALMVAAAGLVVLAQVLAPPVDTGVLKLAGGELAVTSAATEHMEHPASMPAAMMPDMAPAGFRRVSVDVTLRGTAASGLNYAGSAVRLTVPGAATYAPLRTGLKSGVLAEGARLDASFIFEVPLDAKSAQLSVVGNEGFTTVALPGAGTQAPAPVDPNAAGATATPTAAHAHQ